MQLTNLVAAGLAISTTNAFLLPFPAEDAENDVVNALPVIEMEQVKIPSHAESRTLDLKCPGCPVPVHRKHHNDAKIKADIPSHLELDFSIDHAAEADRLMLNGFELYPNSDPMSSTLAAKLLPDGPHSKHEKGHKRPGHKKHGDKENSESHKKNDDKKHDEKKSDDEKLDDKKHQDKEHDEEEHDEMKRSQKKHHHHEPKLQPLGYALNTKTAANSEEDNMELILVNLQVIEVGNTFVDGIPKIEVSLVKTPEGGLMIGEILTAESETLQAPMNTPEECTTLLCKWRAIVMQQVARLRAHKHCAGHAGHAIGQAEGAEEPHKQTGHGMHHGMHHMHHGHRSWAHLLKNIAAHILLPIAVGIVAGVTASILGMMVGTAIVYLWRTFVRPAGTRRHRHGHSVHKAAQHETAPVEEKSGLMAAYQDETEAPPAYLVDGVTEEKEVTEV